MGKFCFIILALALFVPITTSATDTLVVMNDNSNGANSNGNASSGNQSDSDASETTSTQTQSENQVQNRVNNPEVGAMTQEQREERTREQILQSQPLYSPRNERAVTRMSAVATAVEQLIRFSNQVENQGIGDQIREIAQLQNRNQDKINQSIDNAMARTRFASFFVGANYKELKVARQSMIENQNKIKELQALMDELSSDADKLTIANQIMVLQEENISLRDQIEQADDGFSLFGWFARILNRY